MSIESKLSIVGVSIASFPGRGIFDHTFFRATKKFASPGTRLGVSISPTHYNTKLEVSSRDIVHMYMGGGIYCYCWVKYLYNPVICKISIFVTRQRDDRWR